MEDGPGSWLPSAANTKGADTREHRQPHALTAFAGRVLRRPVTRQSRLCARPRTATVRRA